MRDWKLQEQIGWCSLYYEGILEAEDLYKKGDRYISIDVTASALSFIDNKQLIARTNLLAGAAIHNYYDAHPPYIINNGGYLEYHLSGWPWYCLFRPVLHLPTNHKTDTPAHTACLYPTDKFVPTQIIASGLAINTAFYATLWGILLVALPAIKQRLRKRRGLCARCGYEVTDLPTCPECGSELKSA